MENNVQYLKDVITMQNCAIIILTVVGLILCATLYTVIKRKEI